MASDDGKPVGENAIEPTRRKLLQGFAAFTTYALLREVHAAVPQRRIAPARWVERQDELARALHAGQLAPLAWMAAVEALAREVDVAELMASVRQAQLVAAPQRFHNDPAKRFVRFVDADGQRRQLAYGAALFDFDPGNVVTPHAHKHMVSAHLVVAGRFRVRNYDRLRDVDGAMVVRPTRDYVAKVGDLSAMSSARDNIHWFVPQGGAATTFDVVVSGLDAGSPDHVIEAIDPLGGRALADGSIVAPVIDFGAAAKKYTIEA
jgi:hypothetical protein